MNKIEQWENEIKEIDKELSPINEKRKILLYKKRQLKKNIFLYKWRENK